MINRDFYKTHRPFDKLRKKRTGPSFDAVDFHGRDIDLRSIAGVVEAGRRRDRKAGETNEDRIEEAAERLDAMARADASKEFYEGPKFNAERFAKVHKIDMNLRFDRTYERPDQIVANPPPRVTPPKPKPKPTFQEVVYPKANAPAIPRPLAPPKAKTEPTFQEALYPKQKPAKPSAAAAPVGTVTQKTIPPQSVSQMPITKTSSGAAPAPAMTVFGAAPEMTLCRAPETSRTGKPTATMIRHSEKRRRRHIRESSTPPGRPPKRAANASMLLNSSRPMASR